MARVCGRVTLNSIKDAEFLDEVGDGQLLHFIQFFLRIRFTMNEVQSRPKPFALSTSPDKLMALLTQVMQTSLSDSSNAVCWWGIRMYRLIARLIYRIIIHPYPVGCVICSYLSGDSTFVSQDGHRVFRMTACRVFDSSSIVLL